METKCQFDAAIIGGGHNGLVAACYLAMAGLRVVILEKNDYIGGATCSKQVFPGIDARLSVYSYLVSLLPKKIIADLGLPFRTQRRAVSSYTPVEKRGKLKGLIISNVSEDDTRESFIKFCGSDMEFIRYQELDRKITLFAEKIWPTLISPLLAKKDLMKQFDSREEREIWEYLVEKPLSALIEDHLSDDSVRGAVFTDAKIGIPTYPEDPSLNQNRTFLYHVIGQGTGEWSVPVGGMGALVAALVAKALVHGVELSPAAEVVKVDHALPRSTVHYRKGQEERAISAKYILFNTPSNIANQCLPGVYAEEIVEGSVFKINMLLRKLPALKNNRISSEDAFRGTFHINEGYEHMKLSYSQAMAGVMIDRLPGEMYCHSLTDSSILSADLRAQGYQTLTLFGLDVPYRWFVNENEKVKNAVTRNYLNSISKVLEEDFIDCLALDAQRNPCIEAKSPVDLENALGLPKGNIFHGNLTWPFAESAAEVGNWGVETNFENVLICGSSAKRGGGVSGIPGHNAAMKVLGRVG